MTPSLKLLMSTAAAAPIIVALLAGTPAFAQCSDQRDPHNDRLAQSTPPPSTGNGLAQANPDQRDPHNDRLAQANPDQRDPHNDRLAQARGCN
jgi:hypothetical protein